jgi:hypothetical protein
VIEDDFLIELFDIHAERPGFSENLGHAHDFFR